MDRHLVCVGHLLDFAEGVEPLSVERRAQHADELFAPAAIACPREESGHVSEPQRTESGHRGCRTCSAVRAAPSSRPFFGFSVVVSSGLSADSSLGERRHVFVVEIVAVFRSVAAAHLLSGEALAAFNFASASMNASGRGTHLTISKCNSRDLPFPILIGSAS